MRIARYDARRAIALGLSFAISLALFVACGGSGGDEESAPAVIDLGVLSASSPSRVSRSFLNPLSSTATVTALPATGPFAFDPADLPAQVPGGVAVTLGVTFTPVGPGPASGLVTLRYTSGGEVRDVTFEMRATGEPIPWTVTPDPVDFGDVLPGEATELDVSIGNGATLSTVTLTSAWLPSASFTFVGTPFPLVLGPGETSTVRLRFAPTEVSGHGGTLRLGPDDPGGPVDIRLWANSSGSGEQIIDFGEQALSGLDSPLLSVDVPADTISITFEGVMRENDVVGLRRLEGPGGKIYGNVARRGVLPWENDRKSLSVHLPSTDTTATALVAGGGTYQFQFYRVSGTATEVSVRVILERRAVGASTNSVLPLNVFLASGLTPDASTAAGDANLQSMFTQVGQLLSTQGITLGDIDYYDLLDPAFDNVTQGEQDALFSASGGAEKTRLNLFLVPQIWSGQLFGIAGAIDGPKRKGEVNTGVVCIYFDGQPGALAAIAAHEICHYLGLWHTVEAILVHDEILDTPECPVTGTNAACTVAGGGLLMHWQSLGGNALTNGQGLVLRGHACLHPRGSGHNAKHAKPGPWQPDAATRTFLENLPAGWCGSGVR